MLGGTDKRCEVKDCDGAALHAVIGEPPMWLCRTHMDAVLKLQRWEDVVKWVNANRRPKEENK